MKARTNPSMVASEPVIFSEFREYNEDEKRENSSACGGSDPGYDWDLHPSYSIVEDTHAKFSTLSIAKKYKSSISKDLDCVDEDKEKLVQKIVEAGQLEKLKVEQCKVYLRKNGLRLTGNKSRLIQRIKEHLEISNGKGEEKYPVSSFVLNCKGDACTGDVVMFEQNVYDMFSIASRSASGPPCGKRTIVGRVVKESYGATKQQHTFTIEVLWSKAEKPLPPLHPLLIKGRNLYRLKTLRQRWEDEGERHKVLMEKHSRGIAARSNRETRIQEKEKRKMLKVNRISMNEDLKRHHSQLNLIRTKKVEMQSQQQPALSMDSNKMKSGPQQQPIQLRKPSLLADSRNLDGQLQEQPIQLRQPSLLADSRSLDGQLQEQPIQLRQPSLLANSRNLEAQTQQQHIQLRQPSLPADSRKLNARPRQKPIQPQQSSLPDDPRKLEAQPLQQPIQLWQPSLPSDSMKAAILPQLFSDPGKLPLLSQEWKSTVLQKNIPARVPQNPVKSSPKHRQPLQSISHRFPMSPSQKQSCMKQQQCRYYPQGRCYFGDNCKFLHELREEKCDQSRKDRWHHRERRQLGRQAD